MNLAKLQGIYDLEVIEPDRYDDIVVLTHGISQGKENILIQSLSDELNRYNFGVVMFNFRYYQTSGTVNNKAEVEDLTTILTYLIENYPEKRIHLCGKSYGAIVASKVLKAFPNEICSIASFGFIENFNGFSTYQSKKHKIFIVQGEKDDFHTPQEIRTLFKEKGLKYDLFEVKGAGHGLTDANRNFLGEEAIKWYIKQLTNFINEK